MPNSHQYKAALFSESRQLISNNDFEHFYQDPWGQYGLVSYAIKLCCLALVLFICTTLAYNKLHHYYLQQSHTDRYSLMQATANSLYQSLNRYETHANILANSRRLQNFIKSPNSDTSEDLQQHWQQLLEASAPLSAISYFNSKGYEIINQGQSQPLRKLVITADIQQSIALHGSYSSDIITSFINGELVPIIEYYVKVENGGYLTFVYRFDIITQKVLHSINNANFPLSVFSSTGQLRGSNSSFENMLEDFPQELGSSLADDRPSLLKTMRTERFGIFDSRENIFVFMQVKLAHNFNNTPWYYLVSHLPNRIEITHLTEVKWLAVGFSLLTLLSFGVITLWHSNQFQRTNQRNIVQLVQGIYLGNTGLVYCDAKGKVCFANLTATKLLNTNRTGLIGHQFTQYTDKTFKWPQQLLANSKLKSIRLKINGNTLECDFVVTSSHEANDLLVMIEIKNINQQMLLEEKLNQAKLASEIPQASFLVTVDGQICQLNTQARVWLNSYELDEGSSLKELLLQFKQGVWQSITNSCHNHGHWHGWVNGQGEDASGLDIKANAHFNEHGDLCYITVLLSQYHPPKSKINEQANQLNKIKLAYLSVTEQQRIECKLLMLRWDPQKVPQQMLENKINELLPNGCFCFHYQANKLVVFHFGDDQNAFTLAQDLHYFINQNFSNIHLNIGIAGNRQLQSIESLIEHAEIALSRASQTPGMEIGQAYTRV